MQSIFESFRLVFSELESEIFDFWNASILQRPIETLYIDL